MKIIFYNFFPYIWKWQIDIIKKKKKKKKEKLRKEAYKIYQSLSAYKIYQSLSEEEKDKKRKRCLRNISKSSWRTKAEATWICQKLLYNT